MELARFDEQNYQLELQAYQTTYPDFNYKPLNLVSLEIGTSNRVLVTPFVVQPIIKPINALIGGVGLKIIPLPY